MPVTGQANWQWHHIILHTHTHTWNYYQITISSLTLTVHSSSVFYRCTLCKEGAVNVRENWSRINVQHHLESADFFFIFFKDDQKMSLKLMQKKMHSTLTNRLSTDPKIFSTWSWTTIFLPGSVLILHCNQNTFYTFLILALINKWTQRNLSPSN